MLALNCILRLCCTTVAAKLTPTTLPRDRNRYVQAVAMA
jgi:hypothetical protein